MKKQTFYFFAVFFLACFHTNAQKDLNFDENIRRLIEGSHTTKDTTINQQNQDIISEKEKVEEKEEIVTPVNNDVNETPVLHKKDTVIQKPVQQTQQVRRRRPLQISDEALYWSRYAANSYNKFGPYITYRDTIIVNPLFMPPVFKKGYVMPADTIKFYQPKSLTEENWNKPPYEPVKILESQALKLQVENIAYRYIQYNQPSIFDYTAESLPSETIDYIKQNKKEVRYVKVEKKEPSPDELPAPVKFIPDRQYWTSSFESALKFSENYASDNWHKGGTEKAILNIFTKNIFQYNYAKERLKLDNKVEVNASLYSAPKDSLHSYKVGDDLLRFYSNLGFKAFSNWFYTFNAEFKTQMFINYQENSEVKQAAFLSPYTVNLGLGMEYELKKQSKNRKDRSLALSVNISPISYSYMYSMSDKIDLGRHGFEKDEETGEFNKSLSKLGSTVRFDMTLKLNRDVTWKSKLYYFTSYERVVSEFENSLDFAVSRFFSTLIYLDLRFDDGVTKAKPNDSFVQYNQLLSFGFSYKW